MRRRKEMDELSAETEEVEKILRQFRKPANRVTFSEDLPSRVSRKPPKCGRKSAPVIRAKVTSFEEPDLSIVRLSRPEDLGLRTSKSAAPSPSAANADRMLSDYLRRVFDDKGGTVLHIFDVTTRAHTHTHTHVRDRRGRTRPTFPRTVTRV